MVSTVFLWHSWVIWASVIIAVHSSACHIHASCSALQSHVETPAAMHSVYCLSIVDPSACIWTLHCATKAVASVLYLCLQGQQVYKSMFTHYPATVLNSFGKPICGIGKHCIFRHALNFYAACKDCSISKWGIRWAAAAHISFMEICHKKSLTTILCA